MAEYGNPDTDDWEYIKTWSPYHNLDKDTDYPKVFFPPRPGTTAFTRATPARWWRR